MQIVVKVEIPKDTFPKDMHKTEITEFVKQRMQDELFTYLEHNLFNMLVCDHNTAEVHMRSIFIENADGFFSDVNTLLDDPGISKKEFFGKLQKLINSSK